jgi:hypothetical protein
MARWLIRITGNQRREVDVDLVVQAVIALGHQLAQEAQAAAASAQTDATNTPIVPLAAKEEVAS